MGLLIPHVSLVSGIGPWVPTCYVGLGRHKHTHMLLDNHMIWTHGPETRLRKSINEYSVHLVLEVRPRGLDQLHYYW